MAKISLSILLIGVLLNIHLLSSSAIRWKVMKNVLRKQYSRPKTVGRWSWGEIFAERRRRRKEHIFRIFKTPGTDLMINSFKTQQNEKPEVLFGGVICDYLCIIQQLITVTPDHFFSNPTTACNNVEEKFDMVRKNLKDCTRHPIDLSPLKSLHQDFCNPRSDYKQSFNRQEKCLADNVPNIRICLDNMSFSPKAILGGSLRDMCKSLSEDTASCMNDKVGAPCGDEGLLVYERITKSSEPFFTGICLEAAGVQADHHDDGDSRIEVSTEDGMIEAGLAEAEYAEGADDRYAVMAGSLGAPSTDPVLLGSLLLCFLFTTKLLG